MSDDIKPEEELEPVEDLATPEALREPEPVVEPKRVPKPETKPIMPIPVNIEDVRNAMPEPAGPAVVGNGVVDEVFLSSCIYKNLHSRRSLTVYHLQRRLIELGFVEADIDKQGYYADATLVAVKRFQESKQLEATGIVDAVTFSAIFDGDPNVKVVL